MDIGEFVSTLRTKFYESIDGIDSVANESLRCCFERAVNDVLLGSSPKPAPKRKRRTKAEIAAAKAAEE